MDSSKIYSIIRSQMFTTHKYKLENTFVYEWESDCFSMSEAGYAYEVEVKISRSDFFNDFNKKEKHRLLAATGTHFIRREGICKDYIDETGKQNWVSGMPVESNYITILPITQIKRPNCFYYACQWGLIQQSEVPKYAGLIWMLNSPGHQVPKIIKRAPFIDKIIRNYDKILLDKFYWKYKNQTNLNVSN